MPVREPVIKVTHVPRETGIKVTYSPNGPFPEERLSRHTVQTELSFLSVTLIANTMVPKQAKA